MKTMVVSIDRINFNPNNPRKNFDQESLAELSASIKEHGIIQPLVVVLDGDNFMLIAGERRLRAAALAGLNEVPIVIGEYTGEDQQAKIMLIENLQRVDLDPVEEAQAYKTLIKQHSYTQEALANELGVSQAQIANRIRLLDLPDEVQINIAEGNITAGHGKILAGYKQLPKDMMLKAVKVLVDDNVPVARTMVSIKSIISTSGLPLHEYSHKRPIFNTKSCVNCRNRLKGANDLPYCVGVNCWEGKQKEAVELKEKEEANKTGKAAVNEIEDKEKQNAELARAKAEAQAKKAEIQKIIKRVSDQVNSVKVDVENPAITKLIEEGRDIWINNKTTFHGDTVLEYESVIPLEMLIKYWRTKNKICKEASSMPVQLGDSEIYINGQGLYFRGYEIYGGNETISMVGDTLKIENGSGKVMDNLPTLPVYYRIMAKQSSGSRYIYQMVGIVTPNRTIIVRSSSTVIIRKDIFDHWISLVKQLPGIPEGRAEG